MTVRQPKEPCPSADFDVALNQPDTEGGYPPEVGAVSPRVTLKQVAARAGVSAAAASAALTGRRGTTRVSTQTAELIRKVAMELGYEPLALARGVIARQTGALALALPYAAAFWDGNPFNQAVIHGASEAAARSGYNLLLQTRLNHAWQEWDAAAVMDPRAEGVVIAEATARSPLLTSVAEAGFPAVAAVCDPEECPLPCVNGDDAGGTYTAVTFLIRLGHRRIGYIIGSAELGNRGVRVRGYRAALAAAGMDAGDELIAQTSPEENGGYRAAVELLARRPRPTALLAYNDLMARGAIAAARRMGLDVPQQLSVVGFDDADFAAHLDPPLTTVRYPAREIAARAVETLVDLIQSGAYHAARIEGSSAPPETAILVPPSIILPTQLVVRQSCAPPPPDTAH
jgi:DNA-binding LacI/PurR family transcriptional regulator